MLGRLLYAFDERDIEAFLALVELDVEFIPYTVGVGGSYQGHDGIRRWWKDLFGVFPDFSVDVSEVRGLGALTLARLEVRGRGGESGTPVGQTLWQLAEWSVDGKLVRARNYAREEEALEAGGLSE